MMCYDTAHMFNSIRWFHCVCVLLARPLLSCLSLPCPSDRSEYQPESSCRYPRQGCTNSWASNFDEDAVIDSADCFLPIRVHAPLRPSSPLAPNTNTSTFRHHRHYCCLVAAHCQHRCCHNGSLSTPRRNSVDRHHQPPATSHQPQATNHQPPTTNHQLRTTLYLGAAVTTTTFTSTLLPPSLLSWVLSR